MEALFIALFFAPAFFITLEFLWYIFTKKHLLHIALFRIAELAAVVALPVLYLAVSDTGEMLDCCSDDVVFSPDHRLTIYCWILLGVSSYFYCSYRRKVAAPLVEIVVNTLLLIGIVLNVLIGYHADEFLWILGNLPIILLFVLRLIKNQYELFEAGEMGTYQVTAPAGMYVWQVLTAKPFIKYPILLLLCLPVIMLVTAILILFGQKPDSAIEAFTQTYYKGFSQIDHLCANVTCGGHYLCSVAANGHTKVVQPVRYGIRNKGRIICNRQLLVSNAFEELLEEKFPKLHKLIRSNYNKVGDVVHQYYYFFENKYLSDFIYFIMKPLEWLFLLVLYTCEPNPENRIATQYLKQEEKKQLRGNHLIK
ncbi:MAG: hypothetical protein CMO01_30705 [Thalassobius sp.]|nr:hypothetical protein [Thalassovita sp.]